MKQIEEYIVSNKKLMEEKIEQFNQTDPTEETELKRLKEWIDKLDYYIRGLEDAKKYIEEEQNDR